MLKKITEKQVREIHETLIYHDELTDQTKASVEFVVLKHPMSQNNAGESDHPVNSFLFNLDEGVDDVVSLGKSFDAILVKAFKQREHIEDGRLTCSSPFIPGVEGKEGTRFGLCSKCRFANNMDRTAPRDEKCMSTTRLLFIFESNGEFFLGSLKAGGGKEVPLKEEITNLSKEVRGKTSKYLVKISTKSLKNKDGKKYKGYSLKKSGELENASAELTKAIKELGKNYNQYLLEKFETTKTALENEEEEEENGESATALPEEPDTPDAKPDDEDDDLLY